MGSVTLVEVVGRETARIVLRLCLCELCRGLSRAWILGRLLLVLDRV